MTLVVRIDQPALLIVDSHTLLAEAVATAAVRAGYAEARVAASILSAYRKLDGSWKPSALLLDLILVSADDFEALLELSALVPNVPIVLMMREGDVEDVDLVVRAFMCGALGLASKDNGIDSLLRVLEVVQHGEAAIPRSVARAIVEALRHGPLFVERNAGLSPRQRQVLGLVARGLTDRQIAQQLEISLPTVRSHLDAVFEKTRTQNRTAAARWANRYLSELDSLLPTGG